MSSDSTALAPAAAPQTTRGRAPIAVQRVEHRLHALEQKLAGGMLPHQAQKWLCKKFNLRRRQSARYLNAVYTMWNSESASEDISQRRNRCRLMLHDAYERCLETKGFYLDKMGNKHEPVQPDMKAAAKVLELILKFEGVIEPETTTVNINLDQKVIERMQVYYGLGDGKEGE